MYLNRHITKDIWTAKDYTKTASPIMVGGWQIKLQWDTTINKVKGMKGGDNNKEHLERSDSSGEKTKWFSHIKERNHRC